MSLENITKPEIEGDEVYSNFDQTFRLTEKDIIESGFHHQHSAWDFCGYVWYDSKEKLFFEEIWIYHNLEVTIYQKELEDLIELANDTYGYK